MKLKFDKKKHYSELSVIDEIVRARLFADYENIDSDCHGLKDA